MICKIMIFGPSWQHVPPAEDVCLSVEVTHAFCLEVISALYVAESLNLQNENHPTILGAGKVITVITPAKRSEVVGTPFPHLRP